jgi:DNA-binding NarL/FixJ family response regulator
MATIKVVLIDDHYLIHEAVSHQLDGHQDISLAAMGTAGEELEPLIEAHQPNIVLVDLNIPPKKGTTIRQTGCYPVLPAIRRLRKKFPQTHFVILSGAATSSLLEGALEAGASGYLLKDDELSLQLPDALRAVYHGGLYFSREASRHFFSSPAGGSTPPPHLTSRQLEVLRVIMENTDRTYAEHARSIGISEDTLRNHLRIVFEKLGVSSLAGALIHALQLGLLPLDLSADSDQGQDLKDHADSEMV